MESVRFARMEDREQLRDLWGVCFGDSESFLDWFFRERFFPPLASCLERNGEILSALHSYPLHIRLRGRILPASLMAGVGTYPEHRGKGYMRRIILHYMRNLRAADVPVLVQTPANPAYYLSLGHCASTRSRYVEISVPSERPFPSNVEECSLFGDPTALRGCYETVIKKYSGSVARSMADFAYKFRDYASDGARCYVLEEDDAVRGYSVFYGGADRVQAAEMIALDADAYRTLFAALHHLAAGRKLSAKLPPDAAFDYPGVACTVRPQGAMAVVHAPALLRAVLGESGIRFAITDNILPENTGIWNGAGKADTRHPHVSLSAGHLGQLLGGYAPLGELAEAGHAQVHDPGAGREIEAMLPKLPCFIVEEY